jgi:diguanylate cyclase
VRSRKGVGNAVLHRFGGRGGRRHWRGTSHRLDAFVGNGLGAIPIASIILNARMGAGLDPAAAQRAGVAGAGAAADPTLRQPAVVQFRCMVADSFFGGGWIAFMALSAVPSALFAALLVADKIAAGGVRLAMRATLALVLGFASPGGRSGSLTNP